MKVRKTTEALKPPSDSKTGVKLQDTDRIVAVMGEGFWRMVSQLTPERRDVAKLALAQLLQGKSDPCPFEVQEQVRLAYEIADAFMLAEATTLETRLHDYFKQYVDTNQNRNEILKAKIEAETDWKLN